jgi:DNA-binding MarR family transcriptional regulator
MSKRSPAGDALTELVLATFKLNGRFLAAAEELAAPAGLTAAWWQVLGAVLGEPRTVSGIAREMGITRQSVQRIADLLAEKGIVEYIDNPSHKTARLVQPTETGRAAIERLGAAQREWANRIAAGVGEKDLRTAVEVAGRLNAAL